jgi:hypothetical protein
VDSSFSTVILLVNAFPAKTFRFIKCPELLHHLSGYYLLRKNSTILFHFISYNSYPERRAHFWVSLILWDFKFSRRRVWSWELQWWRQHVPLKRRSTIILHGSTSQKTILNFFNLIYTVGSIPFDEWSVHRKCLYRHTTQKDKDKHPCLKQDSNPRSQRSRPTPQTARSMGLARTLLGGVNYSIINLFKVE